MKLKIVFVLLMISGIAQKTFAGPRTVGNGGDMCEDRVKIIRDDISSWISAGGSLGLSLPRTVSLEQFNAGMLDQITRAQISCTDEEIHIGTAEKTCKNFVDPNGIPQILCNTDRFMNETNESDQYVLVHHEFAGLAGFEVNDGPDSKYPISNQISEYLEDQVVKRLSVLKSTKYCPNLSGRYRQESGLPGPYGIYTVTQTESNGITTYDFKSTESDGSYTPGSQTIIADGVARPYPLAPNISVLRAFSCESGTTLRMDSTFDLNGNRIVQIETYHLDTDGNLHIEFNERGEGSGHGEWVYIRMQNSSN